MSQGTDRQVIPFTSDWRFFRQDKDHPSFDNAHWQDVTLPHDWAISGPFDRNHDLQIAMIKEDGEKKATEQPGRTGGLPHVGLGWYHKQFSLPERLKGRRIFIEFDGVLSNSEVYVNGIPVGSWPYGYSSFSFELTDVLRWEGENQITVRVDSKPNASRWYPGAGIYRDVRLVAVAPVHVAQWGTYVTTPTIEKERALVQIKTRVVNSDCQNNVTVLSQVFAPDGTKIATGETTKTMAAGTETTFVQEVTVPSPCFWDVCHPAQYTLLSLICADGKQQDRLETKFGIRSIDFHPQQGFSLNDRRLKLRGVCLHHDLGALGAAFNYRAMQRQLEKLKLMGCNAIRTSHNPPDPQLLDLCDQMGFLVIDEAFDEWRVAKVDNGYHKLFDTWAEKDLRAMLHRDRNHPSIIMWSIGNEIGDQSLPEGAKTAAYLTEICHEEDPTRPVTAGFNNPGPAIKNGLADAVDIPGWNYRPHMYQEYHQEHPHWIMVGSETASCVSSRGEYYFPVEEERDVTRDTLHVTSYDVAGPSWAYSPDYEFAAQEDCPYMLGEFVWTGFDYLGEPTPYKLEWPSRSSYFGIYDLCGFPKDRFYLYKSHWNKKEATLHLLPHWNWQGREGENTPVHCYTSFDAAELFLNGRSLGIQRKDPSKVLGRYRLMWDVAYEPGTLKVVALDKNDQPVMESIMETTDEPARIVLEPDRSLINGDGKDLSFITVKITDNTGRVCPWADNRIQFSVSGAGEIAATDNGDQTSLESFHSDNRKAFHGLCLLIVRSLPAQEGEIQITAKAQGLHGAAVKLHAK